MLLALFFCFLALAVTFIIMGYSFDGDILKIVGYTFIFVLGMILLGVGSSGIMYHDGDLLNTSGDVTVVTPNYSYFTHHLLGFVTVILSIGGFGLTFFERRGDDS